MAARPRNCGQKGERGDPSDRCAEIEFLVTLTIGRHCGHNAEDAALSATGAATSTLPNAASSRTHSVSPRRQNRYWRQAKLSLIQTTSSSSPGRRARAKNFSASLSARSKSPLSTATMKAAMLTSTAARDGIARCLAFCVRSTITAKTPATAQNARMATIGHATGSTLFPAMSDRLLSSR